MTISPEQCRAARALLGWSQLDLERESGVAKKTITDFERGDRNPHDRTIGALRSALEKSGVVFIPQNGGGAGVRLSKAEPRLVAKPRLFRRDKVDVRAWVAFVFDYKNRRQTGFITYDALQEIEGADDPLGVFDRNRDGILACAAEKAERGEFDPDGRVLIRFGELPLN